MLTTATVKAIRADAAMGCFDSACILRDYLVETGDPLWALWDRIVEGLYDHKLSKKFPILDNNIQGWGYRTSGWFDADILKIGYQYDECLFGWFDTIDEAMDFIETYWTNNMKEKG